MLNKNGTKRGFTVQAGKKCTNNLFGEDRGWALRRIGGGRGRGFIRVRIFSYASLCTIFLLLFLCMNPFFSLIEPFTTINSASHLSNIQYSDQTIFLRQISRVDPHTRPKLHNSQPDPPQIRPPYPSTTPAHPQTRQPIQAIKSDRHHRTRPPDQIIPTDQHP